MRVLILTAILLLASEVRASETAIGSGVVGIISIVMAKQAYVTYKNVRNPDRGWEHRYPSVTCRGGGFDVPSQTRYRKQEMWQFGMFSALALTAGYVSFRGLQYLFFTPEGVAVQVKF